VYTDDWYSGGTRGTLLPRGGTGSDMLNLR
jgi:hypothetical protein